MSLTATGRAHRVAIFQLSEHHLHFSGRNRPQRRKDRQRRFDDERKPCGCGAILRVLSKRSRVLFSFVRGSRP